MFSKINLKKIKWLTIAGAVLNLILSILLFVNFSLKLGELHTLAQQQNGLSQPDYAIYISYQVVISIESIGMIFSLLLISMSFRLDQIYYRLKWVNFLVSCILIATLVTTLIVANRYPYNSPVTITSPFFYVLFGISLVLLFADPVILYIKYKNNPFFHNGKFKKNYHTNPQQSSKTEDGYINPRPRDENNQVDEKDVIDNNMSYFEMYEKRSKELQEVEDLFDQGKINEEEYNKKRQEIYNRYDRYN